MSRYKIRSDERKQAGLCIRCGKKPLIELETQCSECKDYFTNRRRNMTDKQRKQRTEIHRKWRKDNPNKIAERDAHYRQNLKQDIFNHYGTVCACCGESNPIFLTLDHINGGGNKHRRFLFGKPIAGNKFYRKMRVLGFPKGFQILCWNCNMAKAQLKLSTVFVLIQNKLTQQTTTRQ